MNTLRKIKPQELTANSLSLDGLDHIFQWAQNTVDTYSGSAISISQETKVKSEVLNLIQKYQESESITPLKDEVIYLSRRTIALLNKINDLNQENTKLKIDNLEKFFALQKMEVLKQEIRDLKLFELELAQANEEKALLMTSLMKHKKQINILENLVEATEEDNARLATMLSETRVELNNLKNKTFMQKLKSLFE